MSDIAPHARRGRLFAAAASVLVLAGVALLVAGLRAQRQPPQPPAAAAIPYAGSQQPTSQPAAKSPAKSSRPAGASPKAATKPVTGPVLSRSVPVRLEVPQLGINSDLLQLGLNADQSLQVPPLGKNSPAGWYKYSPTPGQLGPSVLLGHVDSAEYGPGVFFKLGALRPGSTVSVTRADRTTAVFRVDRVVSYSKDDFPTLEVYGNTDSAQLRLITCGGKFDSNSGHYESNIVAFATLVSSQPA
ncbi:class F sortase [Jatrophihabitans sp.]|jgi:sortase (surface protein transpeptidase)|uniref:class F sortase n=1 Tax=Jatrophihabitans sp. TaxID=1932789 RepID=UPI002F11976F